MHYRTGGFYSSEIIAHVLNTSTMSRHSRILYVLDLKPLHVDLATIHTCIGAIVNLGNRRASTGRCAWSPPYLFFYIEGRPAPIRFQALDCSTQYCWTDLATGQPTGSPDQDDLG